MTDEAVFVSDPAELEAVIRFVRLTRDLTPLALRSAELSELPPRDRQYVHRLSVLVQEDPAIVSRQRTTWLKLRSGIPLLEHEAKELLEVLGCRGFYLSGLSLDGMTFAVLDLRGAVIGGDYWCRHTTVHGICDERGLVVAGRCHEQKVVGGTHLTDGRRILEGSAPVGSASADPQGSGVDRTAARACAFALRALNAVQPAAASELQPGELTQPTHSSPAHAAGPDAVMAPAGTRSHQLSIQPLPNGPALDSDITEISDSDIPELAPEDVVELKSVSQQAPPFPPSLRAARRASMPARVGWSLRPPRSGRTSGAPRSRRPSMRPFGASCPPRTPKLRSMASVDTSEIDEAWGMT